MRPVIFAALALMATGAQAETMCTSIQTLARVTMEARQAEKPVDKMRLAAVASFHGDLLDNALTMIDQAYAEPVTDGADKAVAVQSFGGRWYLQCAKEKGEVSL